MVGEVLFGMLVIASAMSQVVEPAKSGLACQGHTQYLQSDSQSLTVSLEIIVNLADRTVQGFRSPEDFPIKITDISETTIVFHGSSRHAPGATYRQINGGIDRVTGNGEATSDVTSGRESKASAIHSLKCKYFGRRTTLSPPQRRYVSFQAGFDTKHRAARTASDCRERFYQQEHLKIASRGTVTCRHQAAREVDEAARGFLLV